MALDINGTLIQSDSSSLCKITANSIAGLNINNAEIPIKSNRPCFFAENTGGAYTIGAAGWLTVPYSFAILNTGNYYNTSTYAFTAPVAGTYWFESNLYGHKNSTTNDSYCHPIFLINGSTTYKQASLTTPYRLRARTYYTSSYSFDLQINDVFYLSAGDYVQSYVYFSAANMVWYGYYSHFAGCLIG